jgi:ElaB/YqjD/DUF883 family membrane-anchored ribosome-binding protein
MTMPSSAERFDRTGHTDNIRTKANETVDRAKDTINSAEAAGRDLAGQISDTASEYAQEAKRKASDVADSAREYTRDAQHAVGDVAGNFREALERSIERQPMTTVLLAMAAGVVIGGILRR